MVDMIEIKNLQVYAHHGVYEEENRLGQRFVVTAGLYLDMTKAALGDDLDKTVNYGEAAKRITGILQRENHKLIEAAAMDVVTDLLESYPQLEKVRLRLEKPWAPVGLPLETVAVELEKSWHQAYIALGSNLDDRKAYLDGAIKSLKEMHGVLVEDVSDWIETKPYGYTEQPLFLNGCACIKTWLGPFELLDLMQEIEHEAHRERLIHWGPRTLDLDLIFYDNEIIGSRRLIVPHPEIEKRSFVLEPMVQIAPWLRHPVSHKTMKQLLKELNHRI